MSPAIRHLLDREGYFNGSDGAWTVCGIPWADQPTGVVIDCPECLKLTRKRRIAR